MIGKKIFILFLVSMTHKLYSEQPTCKWTNIYNNNQEETIKPRVKPGLDANGMPQYETCEQAIQKRKSQVEKEKAQRAISDQLSTTPDGEGINNCYFTPPRTGTSPNPPSPRRIEVKRLGISPDGNPRYESCHVAKKRALDEWVKDNYRGHREDAQTDIDAYNNKVDRDNESAGEKVKKQAKKQQMIGLVSLAGGVAAGIKGNFCAGQCGTGGGGCCAASPYWYAVAAGLGLAGVALAIAADDNKNIATEYEDPLGGGGTEADPETTGTTDVGLTSGPTLTTTGNTDAGVTTSPDPYIPGLNDPPTVTVKDPTGRTTKVPFTVPGVTQAFKENGLKWDPKNGTITTPDGKTYSAKDAESPEVQDFLSSPEGQTFKAEMDKIEQQVDQSLGDDGEGSLAEGEGDSEEDIGLSQGGFAGYGGGGGRDSGDSRGGMGRSLAGLGADGKNGGKGSKVAGMSIKRGKNRVGVSQDNIFEMIHRRYQKKRKKQEFIELF